MSKILVITGASGFVGSHALKFALRDAYGKYALVIATDIVDPGYIPHPIKGNYIPPLSRSWHDKLHFIKADLTKPNDMVSILRELRQNPYREIVVWHMGAIFSYTASQRLIYEVNVLGTKKLLEALSKCDDIRKRIRRFVFWSGGIVYGNFDDPYVYLPATEEYPTNPTDDYGWSKKRAEDWILFFHKEFGIPITIMRLAAIYGPRSVYGMTKAFEIMARGQLAPLIVGKGDNHVALIHAEDVVRIADFLAFAEEANGEIYNVVDMTPYTVAEVTTFIGENLDNKPFQRFRLPIRVFKTFLAMTERAAKRTRSEPLVDLELGKFMLTDNWMSNEKLMNLAKHYGRGDDLFKDPDSLKGLEQTIEWYRKEGWL